MEIDNFKRECNPYDFCGNVLEREELLGCTRASCLLVLFDVMDNGGKRDP